MENPIDTLQSRLSSLESMLQNKNEQLEHLRGNPNVSRNQIAEIELSIENIRKEIGDVEKQIAAGKRLSRRVIINPKGKPTIISTQPSTTTMPISKRPLAKELAQLEPENEKSRLIEEHVQYKDYNHILEANINNLSEIAKEEDEVTLNGALNLIDLKINEAKTKYKLAENKLNECLMYNLNDEEDNEYTEFDFGEIESKESKEDRCKEERAVVKEFEKTINDLFARARIIRMIIAERKGGERKELLEKEEAGKERELEDIFEERELLKEEVEVEKPDVELRFLMIEKDTRRIEITISLLESNYSKEVSYEKDLDIYNLIADDFESANRFHKGLEALLIELDSIAPYIVDKDKVTNASLKLQSVFERTKELIAKIKKQFDDMSKEISSSMTKEEWAESKRKLDNRKISNAIFVNEPMDFIRYFDPAFSGGNINNRFYFTHRFSTNKNFIDAVKAYIEIYYLGLPLDSAADIRKIFGEDGWNLVPDNVKEKMKSKRRSIVKQIIKDRLNLMEKVVTMGDKKGIIQESKIGIALSGAQNKLTDIINRIFLYDDLVDSEDDTWRYSSKEAKEDHDKGSRSRVIFKTMYGSLGRYIKTSIENYIKSSLTGKSHKTMNCPFFDCNGKIDINLEEASIGKTQRKELKRWKETKNFLECNVCNRKFSRTFVNCPKCLSAVPISNTLEAWDKYKLIDWTFGKSRPSEDNKKRMMREFEEESLESTHDIYKRHKLRRAGAKTVNNFLDELEQYITQLKFLPKNEEVDVKIQNASEVRDIVESISYESGEDPAIILNGVVSGLDEKSKEIFIGLFKRFQQGRLKSLTFEELRKKSSIRRVDFVSSIANKKISRAAVSLGEDVKIKQSMLRYDSIEYGTFKFTENVQLVCPYCFFGLNGEFNPRDLAEPMISFVPKSGASLQVKFEELESDYSTKGVYIGNTSRCQFSPSEIPRGKAIPQYEILVIPMDNSSFAVMNTESMPVNVQYGSFKVILGRGQKTTIGTGSIITLGGFSFKFNSGIFNVNPSMHNVITDIEILQREPIVGKESTIDKATSDVAFTDMSDFALKILRIDTSDEVRENIMKNVGKILMVLYSYHKILNPDITYENIAEYMNSIEEHDQFANSRETLKRWLVEDVGVASFDRAGLYKLLNISPSTLELLKDRFVEQIIPDGIDNFVEDRKKMKVWMDAIVKGGADVEDDVHETEYPEKTKTDIEILRDKYKDRIYVGSGSNSIQLEKLVDSINKRTANFNPEEMFKFYEKFVAPESVGGRDYLDRHLLQNYIVLVSLQALDIAFSNISGGTKVNSTISYNPEEKSRDMLSQIVEELTNIFISDDAESEIPSFTQLLCECASIIIRQHRKNNPQMFDVTSRQSVGSYRFGKQVGYYDAQSKSYIGSAKTSGFFPIDSITSLCKVEKFGGEGYSYKVRVASNVILTDVYGIYKTKIDGENVTILEDNIYNEKNVKRFGGTLYLTNDVDVSVGDIVNASCYGTGRSLFENFIRPTLGAICASKELFGSSFNYSSPRHSGEKDDIFFNRLIYRIGLDKKILELYEKGPIGIAELRYVNDAYEKVMTRLRAVCKDKVPSYICGLNRLKELYPNETERKAKEDYFYEDIRKFIVVHPNNREFSVSKKWEKTKEGKSYQKEYFATKPTPSPINIPQLFLDVFGNSGGKMEHYGLK